MIKQASLERPDEVRTVVPSDTFVTWVEPGILIYEQQRRLVAQRYDADDARPVGEPVPLADRFFFYSAVKGRALLQRNQNLVLSQLVWVDRSGREERAVAPPGFYFTPSISPDQRRLAVDISNGIDGNGDIWIFDVARNAATRVTYDEGNESAPRWSADGRTIIYYASSDVTQGDIFSLPAGGTGKPQVLVADPREKRTTHVSRDGKWILFNSTGPSMDIGVWSADDKTARLWLATPFREQCAQLSPDSKWIAYQSDESGRWEIYVRAFPDSDRKWLISTAGGTMPAWRGDGRELYYVSLEGKMMAVGVTPGTDFESADPVVLFDAPVRQHATTQYDVTADGKRFLVNKRIESAAVEPIVLIQNWDAKLASQ
jgi:Tol biopolymer transport system component